MGFPTRPSNVRVYQFHHPGTTVRVLLQRLLPLAGAGVAGGGVTGAGVAGAVPAGAPVAGGVPAGGAVPAARLAASLTTLRPPTLPRVVMSASDSDVTKNITPSTIVARVMKSVA